MSDPQQQPGHPWAGPVPGQRPPSYQGWPPQAYPQGPGHRQGPQRRRKAAWIVSIAGAVVLLAVVLVVAIPGASGVDTDDPEDVIAEFIAKVNERDVAEAMALVCPALASPNFIHGQITKWGGAELTLGDTSRWNDWVQVDITAVNGRPMNGKVEVRNPGNLMTIDEETGFCIVNFIIAEPLPGET